jgi:sensor c-di-GMP phosphodiesterase-like protein
VRAQQRRSLGILALVFLGITLGAASGFWMGRAILLRAASQALSGYASDMVGQSDKYDAVMTAVFDQLNHSTAPFCSPQEILQLKSMTFQAIGLKDVGRVRNGRLYCTAFLGLLAHSSESPPVTSVMPDGEKVSTNVPLPLLGNSRKGTIVTSGDTNVVLSPNRYEHWDRPHVRFLVALIDRKNGQSVRLAGELQAADPRWALHPGETQLNGVLYVSQCSAHSSICVLTAESLRDVWSGSRAMRIGYLGLGGLAGLGLGLAAGLSYHRGQRMSQQLRRALRKGSLWLVYQPILDLSSGRCIGAEALARWQDEDGVPIRPDIFVRTAEEKGFVGEITAFALRRATEEMRDILLDCPDFAVSINIAACDLANETLFTLLDQHVLRAGLSPGQIVLELTERSTTDPAVVEPAVARLREFGYHVHIDDFGTGFSSLSYLNELAVDAIKIDRSFTKTIGTGAVTASVLPQILTMAASLHVSVIVEGIETEIQAEYLKSSGTKLSAQGWYFSKALSALALREFLARQGLLHPAAGVESCAVPSELDAAKCLSA